MKSIKTVKIRNEKLKAVRNNLRTIIKLAVEDEIMRLTDLQFKALDNFKIGELDKKSSDKKIKEIFNDISDLNHALKSSICICSSCSSLTKDMVFNPNMSAWFCVDCFTRSLYTPKDLLQLLNEEQLYEFFEKLDGPEGCNFNGDNWECNSDYRRARKILMYMGIDLAIQKKFLKLCDILGGGCDCEIMLNIFEMINNQK